MTPLLLVDGLAVAAMAGGLLLPRLEAVRRVGLFAALVTGLLVWFLVRSIPDSVSTLTAQVLRVVAPHLAGPLELKQVELGLAIQGGEFVGAVLVLFSYAIGMRQARAPVAEQSARVVRLRAAAVLLATLLWSAWAPRFLPRPPAGNGLALALSVAAVGAAIGVVALRSQLDEGRTRLLLVTCPLLTLAGATLGQLALPGPALILAAGISALALVYLVGQLVEITSQELRLARAGGMLPATILGFVVGLALGR
jgi:hypothetical protein